MICVCQIGRFNLIEVCAILLFNLNDFSGSAWGLKCSPKVWSDCWKPKSLDLLV